MTSHSHLCAKEQAQPRAPLTHLQTYCSTIRECNSRSHHAINRSPKPLEGPQARGFFSLSLSLSQRGEVLLLSLSLSFFPSLSLPLCPDLLERSC
jgi:hypothetical protein